MKKWFIFIILFIIVGSVIYDEIFINEELINKISTSDNVCEKTLQYSIGNFDSRFGITKEKFINTTKEAEAIWEEPMGLDLFNYNPNSQFKINLVFDERQKEIMDEKNMKEQLEQVELSFDVLEKEYDSLSSLYNQKIADYNNSLYAYEKRIDSYNSRVDYWNNKGGAPENIYYELEAERQTLNLLEIEIEKKRINLNKLVDKLNLLVERDSHLVSQHNINILTYNTRFGEAKEFNQGDYRGNEINIYQFSEIDELKLILVHEFGHVLELDHVKNPESIMYYLMDKQNLASLQLTEGDIEALKIKCGLNENYKRKN
jgi:hypothetical protein